MKLVALVTLMTVTVLLATPIVATASPADRVTPHLFHTSLTPDVVATPIGGAPGQDDDGGEDEPVIDPDPLTVAIPKTEPPMCDIRRHWLCLIQTLRRWFR